MKRTLKIMFFRNLRRNDKYRRTFGHSYSNYVHLFWIGPVFVLVITRVD
jgi:hypothetical protein